MKYTCKQCGKEFEITDGEAKFYREKGLTLPKRCKECRQKNKSGKPDTDEDISNLKPIGKFRPSAAKSEKTAGAAIPITAEETSGNSGKKKLPVIIGAVILLIVGVIIGKGFSGGDDDEISPVADTSYSEDYITEEPEETETEEEYVYSDEYEDTSEYVATYIDTTAAGTSAKPGKTTAEATVKSTARSTTQKVTTTKTTTKATTTKATTTKKVTTTKNTTVRTVTPTYEFRNDNLLEQHYEKHGAEVGADSAEEYEKMAAAVVTSSSAEHKTEAEDGDDCYYIPATGEFVVVSTDGYIRTYYLASQAYFDRQ